MVVLILVHIKRTVSLRRVIVIIINKHYVILIAVQKVGHNAALHHCDWNLKGLAT
jgi:hypothetical protein